MKLHQLVLEVEEDKGLAQLVAAIKSKFKIDDKSAKHVAMWLTLTGEPEDDFDAAMKLFDFYMEQMPYGTAKARTGDPDKWIADRVVKDLEKELAAYWATKK